MKKINKKGYSVLIVLALIGFVLVLTLGIFRLVLNEMKSNQIMGDYLMAYAGAESAQELALLDIKKKGYGYNGVVRNDVNAMSILLANNPLNTNGFNNGNDVLISYNNDGRETKYDGEIARLGYDIIPLFYIEDTSNGTIERKSHQLVLTVLSGNSDKLSWNIIGNNSGVSGVGSFSSISDSVPKKYVNASGQFAIENALMENFLEESNTNYLVLFNASNSVIKYTLQSGEDNDGNNTYFTKPRLNITSSGEIGEYRQNIKTALDNTEYLNILKYSIFSSGL